MDLLLRDLRFAARSLARNRAFAATAILTLALGIGANTVVFSLLYGALLRQPPFLDPNRLTVVYRTATESGQGPSLLRWSYPRLRLLRQSARSFEQIAAFGRSDMTLSGDGDPERVPAEVVSSSYFPALGVRAALGRTFLPDEDSTPGTHPVVLLGHGLWLRRFGGDSSVLGRSVRVNDEPVTVVGVMSRGFTGLTDRAELWIPEMMAPRLTYADHLTTPQNFIPAVGRLKRGVTLEQARSELAVLGVRIAAALPDEVDVPTSFGATALPLAEARIDPTNRRSMLLLFGAVGLLLLLACANLAGLGVARAVTRRQEVAVRLALGASRWRLVRALLAEGGLVGLLGGALGVGLTLGVLRLIRAPQRTPGPTNMWGTLGEFATPRADLAVLGFSLLVTVAAVVLAGLVPALHAGRTDLVAELKDRTASTTRISRGGIRIQSTLVIAEFALALVLSVGAGLFFASLRRLESYPLGFDTTHLLTFRIQPPEVRYGPALAPALLDRVIGSIAVLPGVRSVTVDACAPLGTSCANSSLYVMGRPEPPPGQAPFIMRHYVGWDHFKTLGIPVLKGRTFRPEDRAGAPRVTIINQTAARRFWRDEDPIGRRVWFGGGSSFNSPDSSAEIIGVVGDVPYGALERGPLPSFYTPYRQFTYAFRTVMVRTEGDPLSLVPAVRRAVGGVENLPIYEVRTMEDRLGDSWARTQFSTLLMGAFALLALLLAAGGIYGVIAHSVSQRTRELGIRMALGASTGVLMRGVVGQGLRLAAVGVTLGVLAAFLLSRAIRALLFGVSETDPTVFTVQAGLLVAAALLASYLPARRATRVDPVAALRAE